MAYTTINKSTDHFNTVLYTGDGTSSRGITGVGFQPDWLWLKTRSKANSHILIDAVRGANRVRSDSTAAQASVSGEFISFDTDGFTVTENSSNEMNNNTTTYAAWNWKAGGSAPAITYTVKVVSDSGNKYRFDDFGTSAVTLDLQEGGVYTFDQSDSSNSGHPLRFSTTSNGTHGGGTEYTTGVVVTGTPGNAGAKTVITVAASAPTLYYYCTQHSGMGGQANTNSSFGSSNFSGSIQSTVSANTTAGFSVVKYTGTYAVGTVGHGLGVAPKMIIAKGLGVDNNWLVYHYDLGNNKALALQSNGTGFTGSHLWNTTNPTSSVFSLGAVNATNSSGNENIAFCFAEKTGYNKFGSYKGNGNVDGTFVHTGFAPAFVMTKRTDSTSDWLICDNKRPGYNVINKKLFPNQSQAEDSYDSFDFVSNGFKIRSSGTGHNASGGTFIYMAFGQSLVGSNDTPALAR